MILVVGNTRPDWLRGEERSAPSNLLALRSETNHTTLTINLRGIYTAPCIMILMWGIHITWAIGRIVLKVSPVLGPGIARATPVLGPGIARA